MSDKTNLTESLDELDVIVRWFDEQDEVDVEQGLTKVKEAATLIKLSKARLAEIENEFEAIEKEIADDGGEITPDEADTPILQKQIDEAHINLDEIPF